MRKQIDGRMDGWREIERKTDRKKEKRLTDIASLTTDARQLFVLTHRVMSAYLHLQHLEDDAEDVLVGRHRRVEAPQPPLRLAKEKGGSLSIQLSLNNHYGSLSVYRYRYDVWIDHTIFSSTHQHAATHARTSTLLSQ